MRAVITGASKGIGKAIAERLLSEGFDIAICSRNQQNLDRFKTSNAKKFPNREILTFSCDVANKKEVDRFVEEVKTVWDNLDLLVNNAGVFLPGKIHEEKTGVFEQQMHTNVFSAYYITRGFLPLMQPLKKGHIFNICSVASIMAYENGGSYCISKFALLGFSKVLREEMKPFNINVTALLPGATKTASWEGTDLPDSRFMKPEDVAELVFQSYRMGERTNVEEIILRPVLGDI